MRRLGLIALAGACCMAGGCTTEQVMLAHSVELAPATQTIPDDQLLDVGVVVFDPGVPEGEVAPEVKEELIRDGTFLEVRRAESMYLAVQMRDTLQNSGQWGSVWVTPQKSTAADLTVSAKILHSDGDIVELRVDAVDATGRAWLDGKDYELETAEGAYNRQRYPELDPYQDVFNRIANDLAAKQAELAGEPTKEIRRVASLRYAKDLSPEAFDAYVAEDKDGRYEINRLPAVDDPMFNRTQRVKQRERLFMDTLNQHYTKFSVDAQDSYDGWRQYAREEAISIRELQKSARWRTGLGIASILASVVYGSSSGHDSFSDRVVRDALMYMGTDVLKSAAVRRQEKKLHTDTLEELSSSFENEVQPLVVNVQGTEHRLTGTAEAQYQEWRDLLRQMFVSQTGFVPEDVQVYEDPETTLVDKSPTGSALADGSDGSKDGTDASKDGTEDAANDAGAGGSNAAATEAAADASGDASTGASADASTASSTGTSTGASGGASAPTEADASAASDADASKGTSTEAAADASAGTAGSNGSNGSADSNGSNASNGSNDSAAPSAEHAAAPAPQNPPAPAAASSAPSSPDSKPAGQDATAPVGHADAGTLRDGRGGTASGA
jgi:hypothetical protein